MDRSKEKIPVPRITGFNPSPHGGWILNLKQRVPAQPEEIESELKNEVLAQRRRGLGQATQPHRVRSFSQQGYQVAEPTWSFRQAERIKLELYIAAKKDRDKEIEKELEALGSQLANTTKKRADLGESNTNATPDELFRRSQQIDALEQQIRTLRQKNDPLEREREIISQAKTRLEELKK